MNNGAGMRLNNSKILGLQFNLQFFITRVCAQKFTWSYYRPPKKKKL